MGKKIRLSDEILKKAFEEIDQGLFEADLGGHLFKKRIARLGQGRRGGYRTLVLFKKIRLLSSCMVLKKIRRATLARMN